MLLLQLLTFIINGLSLKTVSFAGALTTLPEKDFPHKEFSSFQKTSWLLDAFEDFTG
jgi:hypothetical protein